MHPPDPRRATAPGRNRGGKQTRRGDGIDLHRTRGVCVYACSPVADECPWVCSGMALDAAVTELIVDLMAVSR